MNTPSFSYLKFLCVLDEIEMHALDLLIKLRDYDIFHKMRLYRIRMYRTNSKFPLEDILKPDPVVVVVWIDLKQTKYQNVISF